MLQVPGQVVIVALVACLFVLTGCGTSEYIIRFNPDSSSMKDKPPVPIYVYFSPEADVNKYKSLTSEKMFKNSDEYEKRMHPQMLKSTVVTARETVILEALDLPMAVDKIFIWGKFFEDIEDEDTRVMLDPATQFTSSMFSSQGSVEIPVRLKGFGSPEAK